MTLRHDINGAPLRRRLFGGYRAADVEVLAARWRGLVDLLESEVTHGKERVAELEADVATLRARLESYVVREAEMNKALADAQAQGREIEERARGDAARIVRDAEERAIALRAEAYARIAATGDQIDDLLRARDSLLSSARAAAADFASVLARFDPGRESVLDLDSEPEVVASALRHEPARPQMTAPDPDRVYEGPIEMEAGPFVDFAALSWFERALGRINGVTDVYVRSFVDDRATIEVVLGEPTLLVRAMAADLPFGFDVQSMDDESLAMTLHALPPLKVG